MGVLVEKVGVFLKWGSLAEKKKKMSKRRDGSCMSESLIDSSSRGSSSDSSSDESRLKGCCYSPPALGWPIRKAVSTKCSSKDVAEQQVKAVAGEDGNDDDSKLKKLDSTIPGCLFFFCFVF